MGYHAVREDQLEFEERPSHGDVPRLAADVTGPAALAQSRARMWRYPPRSHGKRHLDPDQEEVFVPLRGTLTMLLGEPWERVDVEPGGAVVVHIGTPMQARNETDEELVFFAYGAPPQHGNAQFLDDVESI